MKGEAKKEESILEIGLLTAPNKPPNRWDVFLPPQTRPPPLPSVSRLSVRQKTFQRRPSVVLAAAMKGEKTDWRDS